MIIVGFGLFLKKNWAIPMGRLSAIIMIIAMVVVIAINKEAAANIHAFSNEIEAVEDYRPYTWMSAIRYIVLCSMCPMALWIGYGTLIKQYEALVEKQEAE